MAVPGTMPSPDQPLCSPYLSSLLPGTSCCTAVPNTTRRSCTPGCCRPTASVTGHCTCGECKCGGHKCGHYRCGSTSVGSEVHRRYIGGWRLSCHHGHINTLPCHSGVCHTRWRLPATPSTETVYLPVTVVPHLSVMVTPSNLILP